MKRGSALLVLAFLCACGPGMAAAAEPPFTPPMERFVTNRPRLFIDASSLSVVTQKVVQVHHDSLGRIEEHLGSLAAVTNLPPGDYGREAAAAAFLFLCEPTPERLKTATGFLALSTGYYRDCDRKGCSVSHYSATRIQAITAYDWLYNAMPPVERDRLGRQLLEHVERRLPGPRAVPGDNLNDYRSGFYGELSLLWYVGIATRGTGIDEDKSAAAIAIGYDQQMRLLEYHRRLAEDDGGAATSTLGYALRADPWAEFNFFHTMKSAFGLNIAADWPYVALFPNYVLWNRLPGNREFGAGDAFHLTNEFPAEHLYTHLAQIRHFYGRSRPEQAALAAWLQEQYLRPSYNPAWPITPFLLTELATSPSPRAPPSTLPLARHFEGMGQIFMHSGQGDADTYAVFTAGGRAEGLQAHKHFDENSFAIFHKGFLALDSGTRPEPGSHLFQYFCRTVAHNGLLIRMEGEALPSYWGNPAPGEPVLPIANDGGMRSQTGAVIRAFQTTPDYTYIASDATSCYHPGKCALATRQFLHIQPDIFVVFDRVSAVKPEYRKTWLLHTAREPVIEGSVFSAVQGEGRLFCRTLLPTNAVLEKIGGPGREFWSDGRNWPLPADAPRKTPQTELMGAWRIEVSPGTPAKDDIFLHLIEVGDREVTNRLPTRLLREVDRAGVEFSGAGALWKVLFHTRGDLGAELTIMRDAHEAIIPLQNSVQAQSGLARTEAEP